MKTLDLPETLPVPPPARIKEAIYDTQTRRAELLAKGYRISGANRSASADFAWAKEAEEPAEIQGWYWMAHPTVQARLNTLASGDPAGDAYARLAQLLQDQGRSVPIQRALSLGCGFGGPERDLTTNGIVARIDGYDIDPTAIAEARRLASELGLATPHDNIADPSEAIRSADIESVRAQYFTILERRPLGGSLAHLALGEIAQNPAGRCRA